MCHHVLLASYCFHHPSVSLTHNPNKPGTSGTANAHKWPLPSSSILLFSPRQASVQRAVRARSARSRVLQMFQATALGTLNDADACGLLKSAVSKSHQLE